MGKFKEILTDQKTNDALFRSVQINIRGVCLPTQNSHGRKKDKLYPESNGRKKKE